MSRQRSGSFTTPAVKEEPKQEALVLDAPAEKPEAPKPEQIAEPEPQVKIEVEAVKPKEEPKAATMSVHIYSAGIETYPVAGSRTRVVRGCVNGEPYEVVCDAQVEVKPEVAEALKGIIEKQKLERERLN